MYGDFGRAIFFNNSQEGLHVNKFNEFVKNLSVNCNLQNGTIKWEVKGLVVEQSATGDIT